MNKEALLKRKKGYGGALIVLLIAMYFLERGKDLMIEQGGTDAASATILVALNIIILFAWIFCAVMWLRIGRLIRKIAK